MAIGTIIVFRMQRSMGSIPQRWGTLGAWEARQRCPHAQRECAGEPATLILWWNARHARLILERDVHGFLPRIQACDDDPYQQASRDVGR